MSSWFPLARDIALVALGMLMGVTIGYAIPVAAQLPRLPDLHTMTMPCTAATIGQTVFVRSAPPNFELERWVCVATGWRTYDPVLHGAQPLD